MFEAQQAYFYGLPDNLAIASVTSNAAETLGLGHRLGYIWEGMTIAIRSLGICSKILKVGTQVREQVF